MGTWTRGDGSFWDYVKNLTYRRSLEDEWDRLERLEGYRKPAEIEKALRALWKRRPTESVSTRLHRSGAAAIPALIALLPDSRLLRPWDGESSLNGLPLTYVLDLLEPFGPTEAIAPLVPLARHLDDNVRKQVALALGGIGDDACLPPITTALADEDEYVRSYAVMGIRRAISAGRASRSFLDGVFEPILALVDDEKSDNCPEESVLALLEIDQEKANMFLLSDRIFRALNPFLYEIINALNEKEMPIPLPKLWALAEELKPLARQYPYTYNYGETLLALARLKDRSAEALFREAMESEERKVSEQAAKALCLLLELPGPFDYIPPFREEGVTEPQSDPETYYWSVRGLEFEVANGGFAQYFVNTTGDFAHEALAGLEAMNAPIAASLLRRAMALFGPEGPSPDRETRHEQLAALSEEQDQAMHALDYEFYDKQERLHLRMVDYAARNKSHFVRWTPEGR